MKICPLCKRKYKKQSALSRENGNEICPICGISDALSFLPEEVKKEAIIKIEQESIAWNWVEPLEFKTREM